MGRVNGTKIDKDDFEELLKLRRYTTHMQIRNFQEQLQGIDTTDENNQFLVSLYQQQLDQMQASVPLLPETTLDALIDSVLVQDKADEAGITVSDQSRQNMMPTAVNTPNARTGPSGEIAKERKPTDVVTEVFVTGTHISSNVMPSTCVRSRLRPARRCSM